MAKKEEKLPVEMPTTDTPNVEGSVMTAAEGPAVAPPNGRERIMERLRGYNPEGVYDDDETFYNEVGARMDERDEMVKNSSQLADVFSRSPQAASFFIDLMDGKSIYESLSRNFGDDLIAAIESGGKEAAAYERGLEDWRKNRDQRTKEEEELRANLETFSAEFDAFLSDEGYSDEERQALQDEMQRIAENMSRGKHMDFARMVARNRRYDADMESARAEGEVKGRNAKIAEERTLPKRGDGLPNMQNTSRSNEGDVATRNNGWNWE